MALQYKDLVILGKIVAGANPDSPTAYSFGEEKYSYKECNELLRNELNSLAGTYSLYRENKNTIFSLIEETIDDILPKKVLEAYGQFAEIKTFAQGDRPVFTQKITQAAKRRAKQFITRVGQAGIYEVFKLDGQNYEVNTNAIGGAAQIGFEEFLDGRVDFATVLDIVMEGLDETIYREIEAALRAAATQLQSANRYSDTTFVEKEMDNLLSVADSYGSGMSTIYCTFEFAATMIPADNAAWSDSMKNEKWENGYFTTYKRHKVVVLPQSYEDETNTVKVIDPAYAWIIPNGSGDTKPVKIAFEGQTIVDEYTNYDRSREVQVYKKVGVAAKVSNNICVYVNTSLTK